jgi:hypothetical protein
MRKFALSALVVGATSLVAIPAIAPAQAASRHVHHMKTHPRHGRHHYGQAWYGYPAQPSYRPPSYSQSGDVCPGIGRSFECKVWPPPFEDDPDRKTSKY